MGPQYLYVGVLCAIEEYWVGVCFAIICVLELGDERGRDEGGIPTGGFSRLREGTGLKIRQTTVAQRGGVHVSFLVVSRGSTGDTSTN